MTVTQRLMKPGRFHLELIENFPDGIAGQVALFDHIVITPTPIDIDSIGDAAILATSIYTGVVSSKPSRRIFEGADLSWWMGTDQGLGDVLILPTHPGGSPPWTLSQWVTALCPASLTVGSVNNTGLGTLNTIFDWVTRREALDSVCRSLGAEWRVNPDGTIDAASKALLFATPTAVSGVVVTRKADGLDGPLHGLDGSLMIPASDVEQYTTEVVALGEGDWPMLLSSTATGSTTFKDLKNGTVVMRRLASSPSDPATPLAATAAAVLAQFNTIRREIKLSSDTYTVTRLVEPGDDVWVHDLRAGLVDTANQIEYRGELIAPIKLRVLALTWPIARGCGVYLRKSAATPIYVDLSPYVEWESNDVQWEVGSASRLAVGDGTSAGVASLPTTQAVVEQVKTPNAIQTFTVVRRGGGTIDTIGTGGAALNSGRYQITDGKCFFSIAWIFGTASAVANVGVTTFDAPVPFGPGNDAFQLVGSGAGTQAGTRFNFEVTRDNANDGFQLYGPAQVTNAIPGAVTFSDGWRFSGWYWI